MTDWGTESLSNLSEITELKISRVKNQAQTVWLPRLCSHAVSLSFSTHRHVIRAHCPLWGMVICFVVYSFLCSLSLLGSPLRHVCLLAPLLNYSTYVFLNGDFHGENLLSSLHDSPATLKWETPPGLVSSSHCWILASLLLFLAFWPWFSQFTSLDLSVFICKRKGLGRWHQGSFRPKIILPWG